jgi:hypothetical protein
MNNKLLWGAEFLKNTQDESGGFWGLSSSKETDFSDANEHKVTFPASLILACLANCPNDIKLQDIKSKATNFLISQKSPNWSFNYYENSTPQAKQNAFPDDLDDTFCALAGIHLTNSNLLDGEAFAKISLILTAFEVDEGGPYKTWIVPEEAPDVWKDVDLAVNCNIAYFLKSQDITLPNVVDLIEAAITAKDISSPYYSDQFPIYYFIARAYDGHLQPQLCDLILDNQLENGSFGNPLQTAFALTALLRSGQAPEGLKSTYEWLCNLSDNNIAKPYSFGIDPAVDGQTYYAGSSAITVAYYLEALSLFDKLSNSSINETPTTDSFQSLDIYKQSINTAKQKAQVAGPTLGKQMELALQKILARDKDGQIVLMPYLFNKCLGDNNLDDSNPMLADLCLANLYGWIAYTIYDDFLDDEGKPLLLSLANFCLRETTVIFTNIEKRHPEFKYIWTTIMNNLDEANTKEIQNYRLKIQNSEFEIPDPLPDTEKDEMRYNRSMGHALGPIAILCALGQKIPDPEIQNTLTFFRSYIATRQLNDDAHDWEDDLKLGHMNETVIDLLREWQKHNARTTINLETDILELQRLFWMNVIQDTCDKANQHIQDTKIALDNLKCIDNKDLLNNLLKAIQASTDKAKKEQTDMLAFLDVYEQKK